MVRVPGEVSLEGAGVALYAAHTLEVGGPCVLLLDEGLNILETLAMLLGEVLDVLEATALLPGEGVELLDEGVEPDRELEQLVAQDEGPARPPARPGCSGAP